MGELLGITFPLKINQAIPPNARLPMKLINQAISSAPKNQDHASLKTILRVQKINKRVAMPVKLWHNGFLMDIFKSKDRITAYSCFCIPQ